MLENKNKNYRLKIIILAVFSAVVFFELCWTVYSLTNFYTEKERSTLKYDNSQQEKSISPPTDASLAEILGKVILLPIKEVGSNGLVKTITKIAPRIGPDGSILASSQEIRTATRGLNGKMSRDPEFKDAVQQSLGAGEGTVEFAEGTTNLKKMKPLTNEGTTSLGDFREVAIGSEKPYPVTVSTPEQKGAILGETGAKLQETLNGTGTATGSTAQGMVYRGDTFQRVDALGRPIGEPTPISEGMKAADAAGTRPQGSIGILNEGGAREANIEGTQLYPGKTFVPIEKLGITKEQAGLIFRKDALREGESIVSTKDGSFSKELPPGPHVEVDTVDLPGQVGEKLGIDRMKINTRLPDESLQESYRIYPEDELALRLGWAAKGGTGFFDAEGKVIPAKAGKFNLNVESGSSLSSESGKASGVAEEAVRNNIVEKTAKVVEYTLDEGELTGAQIKANIESMMESDKVTPQAKELYRELLEKHPDLFLETVPRAPIEGTTPLPAGVFLDKLFEGEKRDYETTNSEIPMITNDANPNTPGWELTVPTDSDLPQIAQKAAEPLLSTNFSIPYLPSSWEEGMPVSQEAPPLTTTREVNEKIYQELSGQVKDYKKSLVQTVPDEYKDYFLDYVKNNPGQPVTAPQRPDNYVDNLLKSSGIDSPELKIAIENYDRATELGLTMTSQNFRESFKPQTEGEYAGLAATFIPGVASGGLWASLAKVTGVDYVTKKIVDYTAEKNLESHKENNSPYIWDINNEKEKLSNLKKQLLEHDLGITPLSADEVAGLKEKVNESEKKIAETEKEMRNSPYSFAGPEDQPVKNIAQDYRTIWEKIAPGFLGGKTAEEKLTEVSAQKYEEERLALEKFQKEQKKLLEEADNQAPAATETDRGTDLLPKTDGQRETGEGNDYWAAPSSSDNLPWGKNNRFTGVDEAGNPVTTDQAINPAPGGDRGADIETKGITDDGDGFQQPTSGESGVGGLGGVDTSSLGTKNLNWLEKLFGEKSEDLHSDNSSARPDNQDRGPNENSTQGDENNDNDQTEELSPP